MNAARWTWSPWQDLDPDTLYAFLRLRSASFVVEQDCVFLEMDGIDPQCEHLCAWSADNALLGYLRLVPPDVSGPEPALGRVVVAAAARRRGLGRDLMQRGQARCAERHPGLAIRVSAQQHLVEFYGSLGFRSIGAPYLEDGISHVDMRRVSDARD